jgi:hypothetical protein
VGWTYAITAVLTALLGFVAGMLTFKRSQRWCPRCGIALRCLECARAGLDTIGLPR